MVAYVGGARRRLAPQRVLEILAGKLDITDDQVSVHPYRPEDFLVVFASAAIRNRVAACPEVEFQGDRLYFRPWNRQSQAVHSILGSKVWIVMEGIPPHAWERETAEDLLGTACKVDAVAPETSSRSDLSAFRLTAWTANPEAIPSLRWLAIPEPGSEIPPPLLQYKVLIHVDAVADFIEAGEPWFLGGSSDSGQSGLPGSPDGFSDDGGGARPRQRVWQFCVRDARGGELGREGNGGGHGGSTRSAERTDWRLPPMAPTPVVSHGGPTMRVQDRVTARKSAFDCLSGQQLGGDAREKVPETSLNSGGAFLTG
ncbi:hypothetical protein CFC21_078810 [Triticum aestivum]|uniref:DUF4283 domain-containing protein n=2 Tax=Triticum aestivum TaxID=4565 RepID=A0A9R1HZQ0_WHEAT|nr:hypothetical protein CFC21_078810 [Triticum aestivum]